MIVVFGSINLDLVCRVARLPHPGETLHGEAFTMSPGGKGANQALAARRAGAPVALFGAVGNDTIAPQALALLREAEVDLAGVAAVETATGIALIHVERSGENAITVVAGANACARAHTVPDSALVTNTTLLLQLETPVGEALALARRARSRGGRVILNAAPAAPLDPVWLDSIDVLVVNATEAATLSQTFACPAESERFAIALAERHDCAVVVTQGSEGALALAGGSRYDVPALSVDAIDTVGAGDAFVGALAANLDRGASWRIALAHAGAAGALACTRSGAQASFADAHAITAAARALESRVIVSPAGRS